MPEPPVDHFRVVSDYNGRVWEAREEPPSDGELQPHESWLVFTPRQGEKKRVRMLKGALHFLQVDELRQQLEKATAAFA